MLSLLPRDDTFQWKKRQRWRGWVGRVGSGCCNGNPVFTAQVELLACNAYASADCYMCAAGLLVRGDDGAMAIWQGDGSPVHHLFKLAKDMLKVCGMAALLKVCGHASGVRMAALCTTCSSWPRHASGVRAGLEEDQVLVSKQA